MTNIEILSTPVPTMAQLARDLHTAHSSITAMMDGMSVSTKTWQVLAQAQCALGLASGIVHEYRFPHTD